MLRRLISFFLIFCLTVSQVAQAYTQAWLPHRPVQHHTASTIGSLNGNVSLQSGKHYTQSGSDVFTPQGNIDITAQNVTINEVHNTGSTVTESKAKQSGLTASLGNAVVSAAQSIDQMNTAAKHTSSGRMQALAAANAAMSANGALDALGKGATGNLAQQVGGIDLNVSLGNSSSESRSTQTWNQAQGSNVKAGGDINIRATRSNSLAPNGGEGVNASEGNLTIQGSDIKAGHNTTLDADNTLNLLASQSTTSQTSSNRSSSNSVGAGISSTGGLTLNASASRGHGHSDGNDVTYTNTHVDAGNTLTLKSGTLRQAQDGSGDLNIKGAVASGKHLIADIGGNLTIQSLQDSSTYNAQQSSAGFSVAVPITGSGGASLNRSQSNINSNYKSVNQQSGLNSGDGGYEVDVKGDTTLTGGVIASSQSALDAVREGQKGQGLNRFKTGGKLTQTDLINESDYKADASGFSAGVGSSLGASGGVGKDSGHQQGITKSGIGVSTQANTNGSIKPIFDTNKVTADVNAQVQITQSFSQQAPKAVANFSGNQARDLRAQAATKPDGDPHKQTLLDEAAKWDEGGAYRVALHTVSGALGGGANGAAGAVTTASAAPLLDELQTKVKTELVKQGLSDTQATMLAQGLAQATAAGMGAAVGGTQGAATGLTVDTNNRQLHPKEIDWISANAKKYADKKHISVEEAESLLMAQALRDTDKTFHDEHATTDTEAQNYLRANAGTFTDSSGNKMLMFAGSGFYTDSKMYADTLQTHAKAYASVYANTPQLNQADKTKKLYADTAKAIVYGSAKGVVNTPPTMVNGALSTAALLPLVPEAQVPMILPYSNEAEAQVGADTQALLLTAAGTAGAVRGGLVSGSAGRVEGGASSSVDSYVASLQTKVTPTSSNAGLFEVEQTGPLNYRVTGGGAAIDADGYMGTTLLDAKYVGNPRISPYVDNSNVPSFLRDKILTQQQYEFQRYQAVVADPAVPFNSLDILTNEPAAIPYFRRLMDQYQIPGEVKVVPTNIPQIGQKKP